MKERLFLLAVVCFFTALTAAAQFKPVSVIESGIRAQYRNDKLVVTLPYSNVNAKESNSQLYLSLVDLNGRAIKTVTSTIRISPREGTIEASIPLDGRNNVDHLIWLRLDYRLNINGETAAGIVSLSETLNGMFELKALAVQRLFTGISFPVRVRATEPFTGKPVAGVVVTGGIYHEDDDDDEDEDEPKPKTRKLRVNAKAITDADGYAELYYQLPPDIPLRDDELEISLRGEKGGLKSDTYQNLDIVEPKLSSFFILDKPLYQPGQKVQFRALVMQTTPSDSGYVVAPEREISLSIRDEQNLTIYKSKVKTSRFGIVSGEWSIPPDAKIGSYQLIAEDNDGDWKDVATFRISRYELPNFVVQTKTNKPFYLPADDIAEVTVNARYLFGKPVATGNVRVVRESSRSWNYAEQKWDVDEKEVFEGPADANGEFVAKIPLAEFHKDLADDRYQKFKDEKFTAYFTDSSSNRTEQIRFDLRLSKRAVHIYFRQMRAGNNPKLPFVVPFNTITADGVPCACGYSLRVRTTEPKMQAFVPIANGKADKNGNVIADFHLPKSISDSQGDLEIEVEASDAENRNVVETTNIKLERDLKQIFIRSDKTLYATGESVRLNIESTVANSNVFIDVQRSGSSLSRQRLKLSGGRAAITVPYRPEFRGTLEIVAILGIDYDDGETIATAAVNFPDQRALSLTAQTEKQEYRPGADGNLGFAVKGRNVGETALGVVILDRAVEERAATETSFGGGRAILGDFGQFSGVGWSDIPRSKVDADVQRAARIGISSRFSQLGSFDTTSDRDLRSLFSGYSRLHFLDFEKILHAEFGKTLQYPKDAATLTATLAKSGVDFPSLRDPWGKPYRVRTRFNGNVEQLEIVSDGPNKRPDAESDKFKDDYIAFSSQFGWFSVKADQLTRALREHVEKAEDPVLDREKLKNLLQARGIDLDSLRDPWGTPFQINFEISGTYQVISIRSAGENRVFENDWRNYLDPTVFNYWIPYFKQSSDRISTVLNAYIAKSKTFPRTEEEFKKVLIDADLNFDALRDPFGRPYYLSYREFDRFSDRVTVESVAQPDGKTIETYVIIPVTQKIGVFAVRSLGADGLKSPNDWSDWTVQTFTGVISEQSKDDVKLRQIVPKAALTAGKSAILVLVKGLNDEAIQNAVVRLIRRSDSAVVVEKTTDQSGIVILENVPTVAYDVRISADGFQPIISQNVRPTEFNITRIVARLEAASAGNELIVLADTNITVDNADTRIDSSVTKSVIDILPKGTNFTSLLTLAPNVASEPRAGGFQIDGASGSENLFAIDGREISDFRTGTLNKVNDVPDEIPTTTPRVRQYFPETLLWIPELVTDKYGKAYVKFRLGDNVTTWNVYAVASDEKGRVGLAKTEFKTFQPFFVDLDAPKFLTVGDEIYLPSQVRNYTDAAKRVDLSMAKADWFDIIGADRQNIDVNAGSTSNGIFGFRATKAVSDGPQRVTALAGKDNDAVEKTVTVRPDGEEVVRSESFLAHSNDVTTVEFPANSIAGTRKSVLTIYPNTISQVANAMDGLLRRPYGCGEQTISSTYPNLMLIKLARATNSGDALKAKAEKNLKKGYERLLGYQREDGGFGYWGPNSDADIALTAYALRFLVDATGEIDVDREVISRARDSLVRAQKTDGGFYVKYSWETEENTVRALMNTAYVARILGKLTAAKASSKESDAALAKALDFIKNNRLRIDEPYTLALYGLAAADAGMSEDVAATAEKLRSLAIREQNHVYWNLETNTPFYGWGIAGRIETTALVIQLLKRANEQSTTNNELISKAAMFLLKNKDRYGVWYSTQTTINVLDGFLAAFGTVSEGTIRVTANDREIAAIDAKADTIAPVRIELPTDDAVSVRVFAGSRDQMVIAQIVQTHYIPWDISASANTNVNNSRAMRLDYICDKTSPSVSETVTCEVEAERIGFRGYGMLLAEIGIPPGAEVSRESLDDALRNANGLSQYEIHPDRIVLYMWAMPGGTKFGFTFKPRYKVNVQTPASVLYDYYNEEAKATVRPMRFEVK